MPFNNCVIAQQDLIYNGDFEIFDTCPDNLSTILNQQLNYCKGWYGANNATPDYYNACDIIWPAIADIPNNPYGTQYPYSGNGYTGFLAFSWYKSNGNYIQWREYVRSELSSSLIQGHLYNVTFYVSLAERSMLSTSRIGAWLSTDNYIANNTLSLPYEPQIMNIEGNFITDTLNWTKVTGDFIAEGGERFITIGHFDTEQNLDTLRIKLPKYDSDEAYYYLDAVSLKDITNCVSIPNVFTPNDDGYNDFWTPLIDDNKNMQILIYNRWGRIVFNSSNQNNFFWDGKDLENKSCSDGTYYYIIMISKEKSITGTIQLLH